MTQLQIATSRYQARDLVIASGLAPVRITRGSPRFALGYKLAGHVAELTPTREEFAIEDDELFRARYFERLETIGVVNVMTKLEAIAASVNATGVVLLCFEALNKGELCHRRVAAEWLKDEIGQYISEL